MEEYEIQEESGRIDVYLSNLFTFSRSKINKMLKDALNG